MLSQYSFFLTKVERLLVPSTKVLMIVLFLPNNLSIIGRAIPVTSLNSMLFLIGTPSIVINFLGSVISEATDLFIKSGTLVETPPGSLIAKPVFISAPSHISSTIFLPTSSVIVKPFKAPNFWTSLTVSLTIAAVGA